MDKGLSKSVQQLQQAQAQAQALARLELEDGDRSPILAWDCPLAAHHHHLGQCACGARASHDSTSSSAFVLLDLPQATK